MTKGLRREDHLPPPRSVGGRPGEKQDSWEKPGFPVTQTEGENETKFEGKGVFVENKNNLRTF